MSGSWSDVDPREPFDMPPPEPVADGHDRFVVTFAVALDARSLADAVEEACDYMYGTTRMGVRAAMIEAYPHDPAKRAVVSPAVRHMLRCDTEDARLYLDVAQRFDRTRDEITRTFGTSSDLITRALPAHDRTECDQYGCDR